MLLQNSKQFKLARHMFTQLYNSIIKIAPISTNPIGCYHKYVACLMQLKVNEQFPFKNQVYEWLKKYGWVKKALTNHLI